MQLFEKPADYQAFELVLRETVDESPMRICAYALMPNHGHLLVCPECDGELAAFMQRRLFGSGPRLPGSVQIVPCGKRRAFLGCGAVCGAQCTARESGLTGGRLAVVEFVATVSGHTGGNVVVGALAGQATTDLDRESESSRRRPRAGSAPPVRTTRAPVRTARVAEGNRQTARAGIGLSSSGASSKSRK
jgi:hypothetical protein